MNVSSRDGFEVQGIQLVGLQTFIRLYFVEEFLLGIKRRAPLAGPFQFLTILKKFFTGLEAFECQKK